MARVTDQKKVERLKQSTMKLVAEKGFGGASAALIAKDARVAAGYFYMHYKGKYEMVNALLQDVYQEVVDKVEELIQKGSTFSDTIEELIRHFFTMANKSQVKVKFLYVLTNDYSFVIDRKLSGNILEKLSLLKDLGRSSGMIDQEIEEEDLYMILFLMTVQFINHRYKNNPRQQKFTKKDEDHLLHLVHKILK